MNLYRLLTIFITLLSLSGCVSTPPADKIQIVDGFYFQTDEISAFRPCHSRKIYWLHAEEANLKTLHKYYSQHAYDNSLSGIYVSLLVKNTGHQEHGRAVTYDETLYLKKILRIDTSDKHYECLSPK